MSAPVEPLARRTVSGLIWSSSATVAGKLISLGALVVLARLLAPAEFGLFAFALLYLTYLDTVGDLGTAAAVVYWPGRAEDAAQIAFFLNVLMGAALTAVTMLSAPAIAAFFRNPSAEPMLATLSWSFLIRSLATTHDALLRKDLRFRARLVPELGLAAIKAGVAVALAVNGFGAWSLVWGHLIGQAVWTALLWCVMPWRPGRRWPAGVLRPLLAYSSGIVAVNVLAAVTHHADAIVIARMLGAEALGLYQMAYRLPEMLIALLVWQLGRVLFPAYAKVRAGGGDLAFAYESSLRFLALLVLPGAAVLALLAEPLVLALFGEPWRAATPILRVLALYVAVRALGSPTGDVLKASGRPGLLALVGVLKALLLVPALILAARSSAGAVALALTGVTLVALCLNLALIRGLASLSLARVASALRDGVLVTGIVLVILSAWRLVDPWPPGIGAVAAGLTVATAAYVLGLQLVCPAVFEQLRQVLLRDDSHRRAEATPTPALEAP